MKAAEKDAGTADLVRGLLSAVSAGRWDDLPELLHPRFVITEPAALPWGGEHHGVDGYRALMAAIDADCGLAMTVEDIVADGDRAVLLATVVFTPRGSGAAVTVSLAESFTVAEGKLASSRVHLDNASALLEALR